MPSHPDWDDLDEFLDTDDFGSPVRFTLADGTVLDFVGQFDEPGITGTLGTFSEDTTRPTLHCKYSDVVRVRRGDAAVIEGKNYEAHKGAMATGDGMAIVYLEPAL